MSSHAELAKGIAMLSHREPVDGRVSWVAASSGFEDYNEYTVSVDEALLLVDTGVAKHEGDLLAFVAETLVGRQLVIYITRIELDCIGNLAALLDAHPTAIVITANPISPVALVHRTSAAPIDVRHLRFGQNLEIFGFPALRVLEPALRTLGTSWLYDDTTETLFSSDCFCCDIARSPFESAIRTNTDHAASPIEIRDGLLAKFDWLARADISSLGAVWRRVFDDLRPRAIAPLHGRAARGRNVVSRQLETYRDAILWKTR